jgi:hypothetical protein
MSDTNRYVVTITALTGEYIKPLVSYLADNDVLIYPVLSNKNNKEYIHSSDLSELIIFKTNTTLTMKELGDLIYAGFEHFAGFFFSIHLLQETTALKYMWYGSNISADKIIAPPKATSKKKVDVEYLKLIDKKHES